MYILTNNSAIVVMSCTSVITEKSGMLINGTVHIPQFLNSYEIPNNNLPEDFESGKYCYTEFVGFYPNPLFAKAIKLQDVESTLIEMSLEKSPMIDKKACTLDEYKTYIRKKNGITCTKEIESGIDVRIDGNAEHFSLTVYDQADLDRLYAGIQLKKPSKISYHADGNDCKLYPVNQFLEIYAAYQFRLLFHKTYCNRLNMMVKNTIDKEDAAKIVYGIRLTDYQFDRFYEIMYATMVETLSMPKSILDVLIDTEFTRISSLLK